MENGVWTMEQWKKIMWSDESRFTLLQSDRCIMVRRKANKMMHPRCLTPKVQTCGGNVICACYRSRFSIIYVGKKWLHMTNWIYRMTRFFGKWIFIFPNGTAIYLDDNAKIHGAQILNEQFRQHAVRLFSQMDWLQQSRKTHTHTRICGYPTHGIHTS